MAENRQAIAAAFSSLRDRFRSIVDDAVEPNRELRAAQVEGGELLIHASDVGLLPFKMPPTSAAADRSDTAYASELISRWHLVLHLFRKRTHISWERVPGYKLARQGTSDSWRIEAENSAAACVVLAAMLEDGTQDEYHVTLLQMSAVVGGTSKRTLRRMYDNGDLPTPDVSGRRGKAHQWRWSVVRPILEERFGRPLPEQYPADRFVRG